MLITNLVNQIYTGANGKESLLDLAVPDNFNGNLIIFSHGYMGYKDWGCWNLVQKFFTDHGYGFCKYNVSHNGATIDQPIDFPDLESFSVNNYSQERKDLSCVIEYLQEYFSTLPNLFLIGHSRGGGIVLLASDDQRVKRICTWAAIADIAKRFPTGKELEVWKTQGTRYIVNSRTEQKMPHKFSQYEDFDAHREELNIEAACNRSKIPTMVIHGDMDTSVGIEEGRQIAGWLKTRLFEIEEANHTFGSSQPWTKPTMPEHLQKVCELTLGFFQIDYDSHG
jgi:pimeloyl-ACP methyl ester carboxylesterase